MKKDAYYFSHDSNSKDDPKCVLLIEQLGLEGYGIFWILVETLRDQPDYKYPLSLLPAIARRYNSTTQKVETVVKAYNLFEFTEDDFFFSVSLMCRMKHLEYKRELASIAGKKSAEKRKQLQLNIGSTDVEPNCNVGSTSKVKESKVKESKEEDPCSSSFKNKDLYKIYEQCGFGFLNITLTDMIDADVEVYTKEWVIGAMNEAVRQNKYKYSYVEGVLRNWKANGRENKNGGTKQNNESSSASDYDFSKYTG